MEKKQKRKKKVLNYGRGRQTRTKDERERELTPRDKVWKEEKERDGRLAGDVDRVRELESERIRDGERKEGKRKSLHIPMTCLPPPPE